MKGSRFHPFLLTQLMEYLEVKEDFNRPITWECTDL